MSVRKAPYILGLLLTFAVMVMLPVLHADEINQATKVTFNQPVQVPRRTLPAGTYWFERAGTNDFELIRVYNSDHEFITTLFTASRQRRQATEHTAFVFANQGAGKAPAIVAWFYAGSTTGHEFLYARPERQELARDKKETVVAGD
jgi:hypothetical protein